MMASLPLPKHLHPCTLPLLDSLSSWGLEKASNLLGPLESTQTNSFSAVSHGTESLRSVMFQRFMDGSSISFFFPHCSVIIVWLLHLSLPAFYIYSVDLKDHFPSLELIKCLGKQMSRKLASKPIPGRAMAKASYIGSNRLSQQLW